MFGLFNNNNNFGLRGGGDMGFAPNAQNFMNQHPFVGQIQDQIDALRANRNGPTMQPLGMFHTPGGNPRPQPPRGYETYGVAPQGGLMGPTTRFPLNPGSGGY